VSVTFTTAFVLLAAAATTSLGALLTWRILPFVAAGLLAPGLSRLGLFTGIDRVGVARAMPMASTSPLFSVVFAVAFLGERPAPLLLLGVAAIVAGGALLTVRAAGDRAWRRRDLLFPLLAAVGFAARDNLTRFGFRDYAEPTLAAAASALASVVLMWLLAGWARGRGRLRVEARAVGFLAAAGVAEGLAYLAAWRALRGAAVSVVAPLANTQGLVAVALTAVFLRDLERVTWRLALAASLVVAGVFAVMRAAG
jgi:drug/metabolite transporter, DME family